MFGNTQIKPPNIDRLAQTGMVFDRAYCHEAISAPTRINLLTGLRPDSTKIYSLRTLLREALPNVLSLPQHFKNNGYETVSIGKVYHHATREDLEAWSTQPMDPQNGRRYVTRKNRAYLQSKNIGYTFKPQGRPPQKEKKELTADRKRRKFELGLRNHIESRFGEGKRGYDLDLVKTKLPETSESWIATIFFVMNLARWLRDYFFALFRNFLIYPQSQFFRYFKERKVFFMTPLNV